MLRPVSIATASKPLVSHTVPTLELVRCRSTLSVSARNLRVTGLVVVCGANLLRPVSIEPHTNVVGAGTDLTTPSIYKVEGWH